MEDQRSRARLFCGWRHARLGGAVAALAAAALLYAAPASAQEGASAPEYGQGAGVTRARTLPQTGDGPAHPRNEWAAATALVLAAGAGATLVARRQARGRAA